jgi:hypothetical protein
VWLGFALAVACVVAFAWKAPWDEVGAVLADADAALILLASGFLLMTSVARAWRWRHLLGEAPVSFRHRLTSTLIGFAGNNTLPGRLGEPLRCWMLSRLDRRVGFWEAAGSLVVERVFDLAAAVTLLVTFLVLAPFRETSDADLMRRLERGGAWFALVLVVAVGALVVLGRRRIRGGSGGWAAFASSRLAALQAGVAGLRSARAVVLSIAYTAVLWTSMVVFELLMLRAFGFLELGLSHAIGLLVVLSFAIALPQAPAGLGVVQIASETTLTALYGVPVAPAKAFAIGLWVCQVGVVVGAGVVALWAEGYSVAEIRQARVALDTEPPG